MRFITHCVSFMPACLTYRFSTTTRLERCENSCDDRRNLHLPFKTQPSGTILLSSQVGSSTAQHLDVSFARKQLIDTLWTLTNSLLFLTFLYQNKSISGGAQMLSLFLYEPSSKSTCLTAPDITVLTTRTLDNPHPQSKTSTDYA